MRVAATKVFLSAEIVVGYYHKAEWPRLTSMQPLGLKLRSCRLSNSNDSSILIEPLLLAPQRRSCLDDAPPTNSISTELLLQSLFFVAKATAAVG